MTFDWKAIIKTIAPTVATALNGPLAGAAVNTISQAVLGKPLGSEAEIAAAIEKGFSPEAITALKKADQDFRLELRKLDIEEYKTAVADVQGVRELAGKDTDGAPGWTKILTVTHRPVWSFLMLGIFVWTILSPSFGFPQIPLSDIHKDIMQAVIIFYFGGRSIEKAAGVIWGGK